jgi:hypothetical protein
VNIAYAAYAPAQPRAVHRASGHLPFDDSGGWFMLKGLYFLTFYASLSRHHLSRREG